MHDVASQERLEVITGLDNGTCSSIEEREAEGMSGKCCVGCKS